MNIVACLKKQMDMSIYVNVIHKEASQGGEVVITSTNFPFSSSKSLSATRPYLSENSEVFFGVVWLLASKCVSH